MSNDSKKKTTIEDTPRCRPNEKCFNYGKKSYYAKNCLSYTNLKKKIKRQENRTKNKACKIEEKLNSDK